MQLLLTRSSALMGEDVEARREFIQQNAKDIRFLDIEPERHIPHTTYVK